MKKLLIATAAMAVVAGAQAQSSVTVYGIYDASMAETKTDYSDTRVTVTDNTTTAATQNRQFASMKDVKNSGLNAISAGASASSRLGFRGVEDLGGGLSAQFNLEYALAGNGDLTVATIRTGTVGLSSKDLGTLNLGRQLTGLHGVVAGTNPLAGSNMVGDMLYSSAFRAHSTSNLNANMIDPSAATTTTGLDAVRINNGISWVSPKFANVDIRVDYANDKANTSGAPGSTTTTYMTDLDTVTQTTTQQQGVTVRYAAGNLSLAASTHQAKSDIATDGALPLKAAYNAVHADYKLTPSVSLQASYADAEFKNTDGVVTNKTDGYRLGAAYTAGKLVFAAQYGQGKVSSPLDNSTTDSLAGRATKADRTAYQLGAFYNLSKRTALYAIYGTQEQKVTANTTDTSGDGSLDTRAIDDKVKFSQYAIGVRHSF
ncbi:MAG: hypothetical protein RIQ84_1697 [Pseudomonadota bacterium]|jgi:predicted porin